METAPIVKKLRLAAAQRILVVNAPEEYYKVLEGIKYDKKPKKGSKEEYDFVQVFAASQAELEKIVVEVAPSAKYDCVFWACYPKGTGKLKSDIKRETVWKAFDLVNLQAVTQVAIDDTWSALRGRPPEAVGK